MRICPTCHAGYRGAALRCPFDGAELAPAPDELIGARLSDRFVVGEPLGRGAIAAVYRAIDASAVRQGEVAVKVLDAEVARVAVHRQRFEREARAIARLRHPGIVEVLATSLADERGPSYFAMRLYEGETLAARIREAGRLPPEAAMAIARGIATPLASAHLAGVIHRDLKPANVLLSRGGDPAPVVLIDFGMASVQGEVGLTATGQMLGTPAYMSPEQIRGERPVPAVDHYALGCMWFEMLTGRPPFVGTASAVLDAHTGTDPPSPSALASGCSRELDAAVLALLAKSPEPRLESFERLIAEE